jgi:hypothetical protein
MKAIKPKNLMKQLIITLSMLLFLFTANDLYSQQVRVKPSEKAADKGFGASVNTISPSQLGIEILQISPEKYDRNTQISYSILRDKYVEIKIYDKKGMEIKTLVNEIQNAGNAIYLIC